MRGMANEESGRAGEKTNPREMGEQPLARILLLRGLKGHDLVAASARPITHKLVARAASGRRLTIHSKQLVLEALNRATGETFHVADLFDY